MRDSYLIIATCMLIAMQTISAQSDEYVIESFQGEYSELIEYESVAILAGGNPLWEEEFELNFAFPFYGYLYDRMIYQNEAYGMVTDDEDLAFFMMNFTRSYAYDVPEDTIGIESDVRFAHVLFNNMQAFVLQFTDMGFFADPSGDAYDVNMNFQLWFFENGVIEVHYGDMDMDGNPIYRPGKGFYCYSTSTGIDTNEVCGPHMGIENPYDEEDGIALKGSYNDFEVTGQIYDIMTDLPPQGWIIRFLPRSVGIFEPDYEINKVSISPNPASSYINLTEPGSYISICSLSGQIRYQGIVNETKLDISTYPQGIYFVKTLSNKGLSIGKFIKY